MRTIVLQFISAERVSYIGHERPMPSSHIYRQLRTKNFSVTDPFYRARSRAGYLGNNAARCLPHHAGAWSRGKPSFSVPLSESKEEQTSSLKRDKNQNMLLPVCQGILVLGTRNLPASFIARLRAPVISETTLRVACRTTLRVVARHSRAGGKPLDPKVASREAFCPS